MATARHSLAIALASSTVRVKAVPVPCLAPPAVVLPEKTMSMLLPRPSIWALTIAPAPCPMPTMAITEPTPIVTPNMVRAERSLCWLNVLKAMRKTSRETFILSLLG